MAFIQEFEFTGKIQTLVLDPGVYRYEVFGAQGGGDGGGQGGRSFGDHVIYDENTIYIYVGGRNSWNGGGAAGDVYSGESSYGLTGYCGGGASDIRLNNTNLDNRIIVAGGGGGGVAAKPGGAGGGLTGGGTGGTQTSGYAKGQGQKGHRQESYCTNGSGGGGGYWGGTSYQYGGAGRVDPGGGGSGYIDPILTNASTHQGGRTGNGFVKVSLVGYIPYKAVLVNNKVICENIISDINEGLNVNKITTFIDEAETTIIENPENNPTVVIDMESLTFGLHTINMIVNYTDSEEVEGSFAYNFKFVRYGEKMPSNVPVNEIPLYIEAIKTQIVDIKCNLKDILTNNGFMIEDGMKLTDMIFLINSMSNNNSDTITDYINQISNLQNQIVQLNKELTGKVTPAGTATADDVVSGKTFINSTGNIITGSYVKPPEADILYPGSTSWFNKSGSVNLNGYTNSSPWNNGAYFNVDCGSAPKTGWYKMTLSMAEGLDMTGQYRIVSGSVAIFGPTSTQYNGKYNNFTRDFYFYLYKGMPLSLNISGYSSLWNEYSGGCSYSFVCNYIG